LDQARAWMDGAGFTAVGAHHLVPLFQEQLDDGLADVARPADDADLHGVFLA
jgi:hypothetical protein